MTRLRHAATGAAPLAALVSTLAVASLPATRSGLGLPDMAAASLPGTTGQGGALAWGAACYAGILLLFLWAYSALAARMGTAGRQAPDAGERLVAPLEAKADRRRRPEDDGNDSTRSGQQRGRTALVVLLDHCGHPCAEGLRLPLPGGGTVGVDVAALVGTTLVVLVVRHVGGIVSGAGRGEPWEIERHPGDHREFPNPLDLADKGAAAVGRVVGPDIAVETLVVFTGPAEVRARHHAVTGLAALGPVLARIDGTPGGVDAKAAAKAFGLLRQVGGRG